MFRNMHRRIHDNVVAIHRRALKPGPVTTPLLTNTPTTPTALPSTDANTPTSTPTSSATPSTSSSPSSPIVLLSSSTTSSPESSPTFTSTSTSSTSSSPPSIPVSSSSSSSVRVDQPAVVSSSIVKSVSTSVAPGGSTVILTLSSTPTSTPPPSTPANPTNPDSGPIAGGVIGGLFAVAALGMLISFLLRRRRRMQIDKEILGASIFDSSDYRRSAIILENPKDDGNDGDTHSPRPPSMFERRAVVGTPPPGAQFERSFAGGDPTMFSAGQYGGPHNGYGSQYNSIYGDAGISAGGYAVPGPPAYPPQSMQRGYYPQEQQRPYSPHLPGYNNQMYGAGYSPSPSPLNLNMPPSRVQTPQTPYTDTPVQHAPEQYGHPSSRSPFGRSDAAHSDSDHDADAISSGVVDAFTSEKGLGGHEQGHGEELPSYVYAQDDANYADLQRDAKPRADSEGVERRQLASS